MDKQTKPNFSKKPVGANFVTAKSPSLRGRKPKSKLKNTALSDRKLGKMDVYKAAKTTSTLSASESDSDIDEVSPPENLNVNKGSATLTNGNQNTAPPIDMEVIPIEVGKNQETPSIESDKNEEDKIDFNIVNKDVWFKYMQIMDVQEPKVIEEWRNKVNCKFSCIVKLNRGQAASETELMINIIQSLSRVTITDPDTQTLRNLKMDLQSSDIRIQPTRLDTIWILHARQESIINQLVIRESVAYFKRGSAWRGEKPIQSGIFHIKSFKNAYITYKIRGATVDSNLENYMMEVKKIFQRKCQNAEVVVEAQKKRIQIWDFRDTTLMEKEVFSGDILVKIASNSWTEEAAEEFEGPFHMKIKLKNEESPKIVTMFCEPISGKQKCKTCGGTSCNRFVCKSKCPNCYLDLGDGHEIATCTVNPDKKVRQTNRIAQKLEALHKIEAEVPLPCVNEIEEDVKLLKFSLTQEEERKENLTQVKKSFASMLKNSHNLAKVQVKPPESSNLVPLGRTSAVAKNRNAERWKKKAEEVYEKQKQDMALIEATIKENEEIMQQVEGGESSKNEIKMITDENPIVKKLKNAIQQKNENRQVEFQKNINFTPIQPQEIDPVKYPTISQALAEGTSGQGSVPPGKGGHQMPT